MNPSQSWPASSPDWGQPGWRLGPHCMLLALLEPPIRSSHRILELAACTLFITFIEFFQKVRFPMRCHNAWSVVQSFGFTRGWSGWPHHPLWQYVMSLLWLSHVVFEFFLSLVNQHVYHLWSQRNRFGLTSAHSLQKVVEVWSAWKMLSTWILSADQTCDSHTSSTCSVYL